jgi:hypothetical protein
MGEFVFKPNVSNPLDLPELELGEFSTFLLFPFIKLKNTSLFGKLFNYGNFVLAAVVLNWDSLLLLFLIYMSSICLK